MKKYGVDDRTIFFHSINTGLHKNYTRVSGWKCLVACSLLTSILDPLANTTPTYHKHTTLPLISYLSVIIELCWNCQVLLLIVIFDFTWQFCLAIQFQLRITFFFIAELNPEFVMWYLLLLSALAFLNIFVVTVCFTVILITHVTHTTTANSRPLNF